MPNKTAKIAILLCLCLGSFLEQTRASTLEKADSLFMARKFDRAKGLYEELFFQEELASPQMLLKLAYLAEKEEKYARAYYFLFQHYLQEPSTFTSDKLRKMRETHASLKQLDVPPSPFMLFVYAHAKTVLIALFILLGSVFAYHAAVTKGWKKYGYGLVLALLISLCYVVLFELRFYQKALVMDASILRVGPSPASPIALELIAPKIVSYRPQKNGWLEIDSGEKVVYVFHRQALLFDAK